MVTEIKLGLCNPPEPIYLYVNQGEVDGESYVWYKFNISQDKKIPVTQRALTGYLSELRLTTKEFKGKDNLKLDIVISADELYVFRTGIETNFAKSFLLAASLVQDFSKPLIIVANAGEQNTVFCNLYDAVTKSRIEKEWNKNADWGTLINDIQSRLGGTSSTILSIAETPVAPAKLSVVPQPVHPQDLRVKNIRTLLDYPLDLVREWLQFQDVDRPSLLHISKINELVKTMCLAWAADKCEYPNHAESSYQKVVVDAVGLGADELTAINTWMQHLQSAKAGAL
ncbi:hypothetical protein CDG77_32430 [Nostoc sp. 'Peltigera membranacea cyanobiont' 213]|uniref:hypothetical protein n=1 Tax=Nostoc cyanobionts TaxID=3123326 RepID=UPI000B955E8B|nr:MULTISPECIES: hypothetical protein [unclassified Nostoc]AVH66294.1 hypothetical protein NPM_4809 [Nostoc sp. 'Peltigera membranacea cyanobiont' N6]OYD86900.1 hypothetical protein CDG77_32430 [Nostoc sp. 'Peltigera membranacea cyanobiont' 213]